MSVRIDIGNKKDIAEFNNVAINLKFDSIADRFSLRLYFDPNKKDDIAHFRPGTYSKVAIYHDSADEDPTVFTGVILSHRFSSAGDPPRAMVELSGYSITGVLNDCPVVLDGSIQSDSLSLIETARAVCKHYGIGVQVDPEVQDICDTVVKQVNANVDQSVADYLDGMAKQLNVTLSHTQGGDLLLTRAKSNSVISKTAIVNGVIVNPVPFSSEVSGAPAITGVGRTEVKEKRKILFDFGLDKKGKSKGGWTKMSLAFDGQRIHSDIVVVSQAQKETETNANPNAIQSADPVFNPYYVAEASFAAFNKDANSSYTDNQLQPFLPTRGSRPRTFVQTHGDDNITPDTGRSVLGDELKNFVLTIDVPNWTLGDVGYKEGSLILPNKLIKVANPDLFLFKESTWFIQEVELRGDEKSETATITCVLPECFNDDDIVNIFL